MTNITVVVRSLPPAPRPPAPLRPPRKYSRAKITVLPGVRACSGTRLPSVLYRHQHTTQSQTFKITKECVCSRAHGHVYHLLGPVRAHLQTVTRTHTHGWTIGRQRSGAHVTSICIIFYLFWRRLLSLCATAPQRRVQAFKT